MIVFLPSVIHNWCCNLQKKSCKDLIGESGSFEFINFKVRFFSIFNYIILTMYSIIYIFLEDLVKYLCNYLIDHLRVLKTLNKEGNF